MMMQDAFNDILLNSAKTGEIKKEKNSSLFNENSSLLTSSIFTNNFFSNLIANDYNDSKENYYNIGNELNENKTSLSSSPLSSGLSSLSSSLNSSITSTSTSVFTNSESDSLMSRSSSTGSLMDSKFKNEIINTSPGPVEKLKKNLGNNSNNNNNNSKIIKKFDDKTEDNNKGLNRIDWNLLNNSELFSNNAEDYKWMNKLNNDFFWNLNRLTEIAINNSNNNKNSYKYLNNKKQQCPRQINSNNHQQQLRSNYNQNYLVNPYYSANSNPKPCVNGFINTLNSQQQQQQHQQPFLYPKNQLNRGILPHNKAFLQRC